MKKKLLICVAILSSLNGFTQSFTDGASYYHLQYDNAASDSSCLANTVSANHGGAAFGGGNVDAAGYSDMGSPDAVYFIATPGTIDPLVTPYYYDIYYTNGMFCDPMSKTGGPTVGVDISASKKVFVTAKSAAPTSIEFFIASGSNGAFPASGTYGWVSTTKTINLTTSYATYELDWTGIAEFESWAGRTKVNLWGIRMSAANDEVYVQTIDFGQETVAGVTKSTEANKISLYPNPSNGTASITTSGKAGQLVITNTSGVVVETIDVTSQQTLYEVTLLNKGVYIVKFTSEENSTAEKLVIN